MIRFILRRRQFDANNGVDASVYFTLDIDVPALKAALSSNGYGPEASDFTSLIGVELLPPKAAEAEAAR